MVIEDGVHHASDRPRDRHRPVLHGDLLHKSAWPEQARHRDHVRAERAGRARRRDGRRGSGTSSWSSTGRCPRPAASRRPVPARRRGTAVSAAPAPVRQMRRVQHHAAQHLADLARPRARFRLGQAPQLVLRGERRQLACSTRAGSGPPARAPTVAARERATDLHERFEPPRVHIPGRRAGFATRTRTQGASGRAWSSTAWAVPDAGTCGLPAGPGRVLRA